MTTPYANYFVVIMGNFRPFYQSMRTEIITFFRTLLFSELYCRIPCNLKYIHLFLIGSWTTTSWRIYHQAFSVTIPSWNGCKSGVFLNIGVWATHGIQPSKETFECVGDIAYLGYLLIKLHLMFNETVESGLMETMHEKKSFQADSVALKIERHPGSLPRFLCSSWVSSSGRVQSRKVPEGCFGNPRCLQFW